MSSFSSNAFGAPSSTSGPSRTTSARPSLPPRELELHPSSAPAAASSAAITHALPTEHAEPLSQPGLLLYFDKCSLKAVQLERHLEVHLTRTGQTFPTTSEPTNATHVILDPTVQSNRAERVPKRAGQHVVSLEWVIDSFFAPKCKPEEDYPVPQLEEPVWLQGHVGHAGDGLRDERLPNSAYVMGARARQARKDPPWRVVEEELFALFLAFDRPPGLTDVQACEVHARAHPERTAMAYYKHWRSRREAIDTMVDELLGVEHTAQTPRRPSSPLEKDEASDLSDLTSDDEQDGPGTQQPSSRYTSTETRDLTRLINTSSTHAAAFRAFVQLHPHRKYTSVEQHYYTRIAQRTGRTLQRWSPTEDADLVRLLAAREGSLRSVFEAFALSHPQRNCQSAANHYQSCRARLDAAVAAVKAGKKLVRDLDHDEHDDDDDVESEDDEFAPGDWMDLDEPTAPPAPAYAPHSSVAGSSRPRGSFSAHSPPPARISTPSTFADPASPTSANSLALRRADTGVARPPSPVVHPVASSSGHPFHHAHQYHSQPIPHIPAPLAVARPPSLAPLDDIDLQHEPPAFLSLGVAPQFLIVDEPFCHWCGEYDSSKWPVLDLGLRGCVRCKRWVDAKVAQGVGRSDAMALLRERGKRKRRRVVEEGW